MEALTLVIPVYDEGDNIAATLRGIAEHVRVPYRIHLVYDKDDDNTLPPARAVADELDLPLHFVKNNYGRGVLNAIKTGLYTAETEYIIVTMADLSDPPEVVNRLVDVAMAEKADLVCASRYMPQGKQIGGPFLKSLLSRTAGLSLYYLAAVPTRDATNSFKLYTKRLFEKIEIESEGGFELGLEIVVKAHFAGFKVIEVPTVWRDRTAGESRFRLLAWIPHYLRWYLYAFKQRYLPKKSTP